MTDPTDFTTWKIHVGPTEGGLSITVNGYEADARQAVALIADATRDDITVTRKSDEPVVFLTDTPKRKWWQQ